MLTNLVAIAYVVSGVFFIIALRGLSSPESSRRGNIFGILGMVIAILATLFSVNFFTSDIQTVIFVIVAIAIGGIVGAIIAKRIAMTDMPQLVAGFHSLVGLAAVFVALAAFYAPEAFKIGTLGNIKTLSLVEMSLGAVIGAITFSGSVIAFGKLQGIMSGSPIVFKGQHMLNLLIGIIIIAGIVYFCFNQDQKIYLTIIALSFLIGFLIIIPIGGADMPVVVSMLNSYSGWAAAGIGFTLGNTALIITGALVGSSGAILSYIMCAAMNRSFISVILGGFGGDDIAVNKDVEQRPVKEGGFDDAAFIMKNAGSVIIVPGYGMAVAQAQHVVRELGELLEENGTEVKYGIHPVAGRMPGHMNVLLAEANVSYDVLAEPEDVNPTMDSVDVAVVIGANDVVNPSATEEPGSPIYGMPIIEVHNAKTVFVLKRSMSSGFAGVQNPLFFKQNTRMLFGDAKESIGGVVSEFKD